MPLWRASKREHCSFREVFRGGKRCRTRECRRARGCERLTDNADGLVIAVGGDLLERALCAVPRGLGTRAGRRPVGVNVSLDDEGLEEDRQKRGKAEGKPAPFQPGCSFRPVASAHPHGDVILYHRPCVQSGSDQND